MAGLNENITNSAKLKLELELSLATSLTCSDVVSMKTCLSPLFDLLSIPINRALLTVPHFVTFVALVAHIS